MKVKFRVNLGSRDAIDLGLDYTKCTKDSELEVSLSSGEQLAKRNLVDVLDIPVIEAVPPKPAIAEAKPGSVEKATADLKAYKVRASVEEEETKPATKAAETVSKPSTAKK